MLPYYLLIQLPEDDELSFVLMQPFTPLDRPNMVSFMAAKSGPAEYGRLIDFRLPAQTACAPLPATSWAMRPQSTSRLAAST